MSDEPLFPATISWQGDIDGHAELIDQTLLPERLHFLRIDTVEAMIDAIRRLAVRGAPAIGVAGAFGACLAVRCARTRSAVDDALACSLPLLAAARPTAVNLQRMVSRVGAVSGRFPELDGIPLRARLLAEAHAICAEDRSLCRLIGAAGAPLIREDARVLTHCNAGALATAGEGTALAVFYAAQRAGVRFAVVADETRPLLQGSRLTAWELARAEIPVTVICDNAAAHLFQRGEIDLVITGADRIASSGDTANKIGTYAVACLARAHNVPFYIAAPSTSFDFALANGQAIPIEERGAEEVWHIAGGAVLPAGIRVRNPAFDVTPHDLISGWITERGILQPPFAELR